MEVYNDLDGELCNAFRMVREHPEELCRIMEFRVNARSQIAEDQHLPPYATEIQRAAAFIHSNMISFGGGGNSYGVVHSKGGGAQNSLANRLELIRECSARLDRVMVECLPWDRLLDLYDKPNALFFLDPPYVSTRKNTITAYDNFSQDEAARLIERVKKLKGKWVLTINDSPENRELLQGYLWKRLKTAACINRSDHKFGEIIATNFNQ